MLQLKKQNRRVNLMNNFLIKNPQITTIVEISVEGAVRPSTYEPEVEMTSWERQGQSSIKGHQITLKSSIQDIYSRKEQRLNVK